LHAIRPRASAIGAGSVQYSSKVNNKGTDGTEMRGGQVSGQQFVDRRPTNGTAKTVEPGAAPKSCWHCGGHHLKRNCPQLSAGERPVARSADASVGGRTKSVRVNQAVVAACGSEPAAGGEVQVQSNQCVVSRLTCVAAGAADGGGTSHVFVDGEVPSGGGDAGVTERAGIAGMQGLSQSTMVTRAVDDAAAERQGTGTREGGSRGYEPRIVDCVEALSYVNVTIKEVPGKVIRALNDSGSQLTIVKTTVLEGHAFPACGSVKIRGLLGAPVAADLTYLTIALADCTNCSLRLLCAVSDDVYEDLIIPAAVVTRLNDQFNDLLSKANPVGESCSTDAVAGNAAVAADASGSIDARSVAEPDISDSNFLDVDQVDGAAIDPSVATVAELQREQAGDKTLASEWALVKRNKGNLLVKDGLLFCYEKVCGQTIECLVVPEGRRRYVFDIAHSVTGGHFNFRKTRDRIKLSGLSWNTLTRDCKEWVKCCEICQKMSRITCYDRIPIQAVQRSPSLFAHFFCDVFGPVLPDQHTRYNYCLVIVDSNSLWVSAYPLRNLTAKSICSALINMFSYTGLSSEVTVMSTDNATYFKAELTREFLKRIGVSPRFHMPHASWSTGLIERHLQTVKRVLGKLAVDHPKQWHEYLPYALWALRESVSNPLQMQPFMMVTGGRRMRGPLSILRDTWLGFPVSLGKRTEDFLKEVQAGLEAARTCAEENTRAAQQRYVSRYNLRARPKKFALGQSCLILQPDSISSRMFSRWKGPATVIEVKWPDSYVVELEGRRYHLHANHLRPYNIDVAEITCSIVEVETLMNVCECIVDVDNDSPSLVTDYCSVVYDGDTDFGDIGEVGAGDRNERQSDDAPPSSLIKEAELVHLSIAQRTDLMALVDAFAICFSDVPGLCTAVVHEIPTTKDFIPKRVRGFRIPETLREEVDRQIAELLRAGFIQESTFPMSSPIVAVIKPSGGVRICVNYQYLNLHTIPDQITLPDMASIIHRVGKSRFISVFDAPSGYHQCEVAKKDRWKTAFVCGSSLFEWVRCPFGLRSSGCTFVRALNRTLAPVRAFTDNYVDDIAVHSMTWERHLMDLRKFLAVMAQSGFTLSLKKAKWAHPQVKFLGNIIGSGERKADPERVEAIKSLRVPETKKQLRQVLGLFGHFHDYIQDFAKVAYPLTELTGKRYANRIPWGSREQEAFDTLKERLIQATIEPIGVIDVQKPFVVMVDACDYAVAGILVQATESGVHRPVAFASCKLSPSQRRWAIIEKECYAMMWSLRKFKQWIFGVPTVIQTDHNPLTYLTETAPKNAKLMRWLLAVQEFNNVRFEFRAGSDNAAADCVSRMVHCDEERRK
jgi:hypothetical protein